MGDTLPWESFPILSITWQRLSMCEGAADVAQRLVATTNLCGAGVRQGHRKMSGHRILWGLLTETEDADQAVFGSMQVATSVRVVGACGHDPKKGAVGKR